MVYLAPTLRDVLGLPEYGPITAWADVIHPDDRPQHTRAVAALYRGEVPAARRRIPLSRAGRHLEMGAPARHRGARSATGARAAWSA